MSVTLFVVSSCKDVNCERNLVSWVKGKLITAINLQMSLFWLHVLDDLSCNIIIIVCQIKKTW